MTHTPYQEWFSVCDLRQDLRDKFNAEKNLCLGWLGERGWDVSVSRELDDLAELWEQHREVKRFRVPNFDIGYWPNARRDNTLILFLERDGARWGSCGFRLIDLFDRRAMQPLTLREAINGLYYYYLDPALAPEGETARCHIHGADLIQDCMICVAGDAWIHPRYQGLDLFKAFGRLSRLAVVVAREFLWSWCVAVVGEKNRELALRYYGFAAYHPVAMEWRGEPWWLATMSREDAIQMALTTAGKPLDAPVTW